MARKTLPMRQIQEILRLRYQNRLAIRKIARSCGLPTSTVGDYLHRAEIAGLNWPLPEGLSEPQLMERLMAAPAPSREPCQVLPDWPQVPAELRRKSVTLQLLWEEYRAVHPEGYSYTTRRWLFPPASKNLAIKRRWKRACRLPNGRAWRPCATSGFSAWPS